VNILKDRALDHASLFSQINALFEIAQASEDFFKSSVGPSIEKIKAKKNVELQIWEKTRETLSIKENRNHLLLASLCHRLAEEISLATIETSEFKVLPTPESILMIQKTKEAIKALLKSIRAFSKKSAASEILISERLSVEIFQIFKKARLDALKDKKDVRGLKNSEIALRFSEIADIIEKMTKVIGELIAMES
jgi:hypothetical protein